ncbi:rhomboid family intramembrane serine protease [Weeksellaceae bacterium A-14]
MPKKIITLRAIAVPLIILSLMWLGFLLQMNGFFPSCEGSLIPFVPEGLKGIILSPFLHGSWEHLLGNSVPMAVLLFLLFQFYPQIAFRVLVYGWLLTGGIVWLMPPNIFFGGQYTCIIGASGIVYMLAFFLFFSGIFRWNMKLLTISLLVVLYYGSLIWGMFPEELFGNLSEPSKISWQAHATGALVGTVLAFAYKGKGEKKKKYIWEFPDYYSEKDDKIWQEYVRNHPEDFQEMPHKENDNIWEYLDELRKKK